MIKKNSKSYPLFHPEAVEVTLMKQKVVMLDIIWILLGLDIVKSKVKNV